MATSYMARFFSRRPQHRQLPFEMPAHEGFLYAKSNVLDDKVKETPCTNSCLCTLKTCFLKAMIINRSEGIFGSK
jgi:hypothetical protein